MVWLWHWWLRITGRRMIVAQVLLDLYAATSTHPHIWFGHFRSMALSTSTE